MNTLPDLSQLTHEQLLEFTRQLAMQHQSLAQSNQDVNGNLKLTPFTLKQQSKIDPFDDLLRLNLWLNSYSLFIF